MDFYFVATVRLVFLVPYRGNQAYSGMLDMQRFRGNVPTSNWWKLAAEYRVRLRFVPG